MENQEETTVPSRTARLVLVTPDGTVVGCLAPIPVEFPGGRKWSLSCAPRVTVMAPM